MEKIRVPDHAKLLPILGVALTLLVSACGGGGGGGTTNSDNTGTNSNSDTVTFSGGSLDDLKALNPSLSFENLEISGGLSLPFYSSDTITANNLTITENGSISYSYSTCEYKDAPSITLDVAQDITIAGEIRLRGRSGTIVSSSATCNSCYGQNGGDVSITAGGNIYLSGRILNGGGAGASVHYSGFPSSPCSAGDSGNLHIEAGGNMTLNSMDIDNRAGRNFDGVYGTSGNAVIHTGNQFSMSSGSIATTGSLSFQANLADIAGPITYGSLSESLGGSTDTTPPLLTLVNPQPYDALDWHQPFQIQLQASDNGMGLRHVQVTGFGHDATHYESEFVNGMLSIDIAEADTPTNLDIVVTDNKGLQSSTSVAGLSIAYPQEVEPNNNLLQAQAIEAGGLIVGDILTGDSGYTSNTIQSYMMGLGDPNWSSRLAEDVYAITLPAGVTSINVTLDFSGNSNLPDIDLYLLNSNGTVIVDTSLNDNPATSNYTESINFTGATAGTTYYLALQAYNVTTRASYRLTRN